MHEITLTAAQYEAIGRVRESMSQNDRESTKRVNIRRDGPQIIRVTFDSGWGTSAWDIDAEGNSEHIGFPSSTMIGETLYDLDPADDRALAERLRHQLGVKEDRRFPFTEADVALACQHSDILDRRLNTLYADWRGDRITDEFYNVELLKLGYTKDRQGGRPVLASGQTLSRYLPVKLGTDERGFAVVDRVQREVTRHLTKDEAVDLAVVLGNESSAARASHAWQTADGWTHDPIERAAEQAAQWRTADATLRS